MTVVLVHGAPETDAVWEPLVDELATLERRDVVRLSPPGFGAPLPHDFNSTVNGYREWLIDELSKFDTPVDLVGHDWGGGHAMGVAMSHPELLRSWVIDIIGAFEPDYVWHPAAQVWQMAGQGELSLQEIFGGTLAERAERMTQWGIPEPAASAVAAGQGEEMGRAMLSLYRSAIQPVLSDLGRDLPSARTRPGMVLLATEDEGIGSHAAGQRGAERAGARLETLEGLGHWWMLEDSQRAASVLTRFWGTV